MKTMRTYEALVQYVNTEYGKLETLVNDAINKVRDDAGPEDAFDVALGLANRLSFYALRLAVQLHSASVEISRDREVFQDPVLFPPN